MEGEEERKEVNSTAGEEETTFSNTEVIGYVFPLIENVTIKHLGLPCPDW